MWFGRFDKPVLIWCITHEQTAFGLVSTNGYFAKPVRNPNRFGQNKQTLYQKGNFELTRKDASDFAKDRYFNGYSDNRSVQENFDLINFFIQESADKNISLLKPAGRYLRSLG